MYNIHYTSIERCIEICALSTCNHQITSDERSKKFLNPIQSEANFYTIDMAA